MLKSIPKSPGIYQFFNKDGKIIYIGKSVNLFSRVNSYFNGKSKLNFAKKKMVSEIDKIETIVVNNEKESLILETTLIKKHKPKYNILMKDDKNHLYIKITNEEIPKIIKTRIKTNFGIYFGPFISSNHVNNVLKVVKKIFGYRSCNIDFNLLDNELKIKSVAGTKIPCIDYYTKRCSGPCLLTKESIENYKKGIENIKNFLNGDFKQVISTLQNKMLEKAKDLKFEEALSIKQDIESIKSLEENSIVRDYVIGNYDVINYLEKYEKIYIGLVSIRDSKIVDLRNYEIEAKLGESIEEILEYFIEREINFEEKQTLLLPIELKNSTSLKSETPKVGPKLEIIKFVYKNIYEYAYKKHLNSLSTKGFTKQTMKNLLSIMGYNEINKSLIFECNDISHLSGTHTVASRSIIENGKTNPSKYRKFNIKTLENLKIDDFSSMKEIMTRRLKELIEKGNLPDLITIDGGIGQLNSVLKIIEEFKNENRNYEIHDSNYNLIYNLQLVSIAKREEELFLPGIKEPIVLEKDSQELRLIQKIRDEAHRFAITFNRDKRIKSMKKNILEEIPGIGPKTRTKLIKTYGNIENLKGVSKEELKKLLSINQIEALENHGII
nr:excinuclease ABC subunit UvrC [Candidatus Gracilibacteria bacterium]